MPPLVFGHIVELLRDFLQERWKGNLPILWGSQLRQARLNELIYLSNLNIPDLPGESKSTLSPEYYLLPASEINNPAKDSYLRETKHTRTDNTSPVDIIVIGAGLSAPIERLCQFIEKVNCDMVCICAYMPPEIEGVSGTEAYRGSPPLQVRVPKGFHWGAFGIMRSRVYGDGTRAARHNQNLMH
jgi:hypothetical protein